MKPEIREYTRDCVKVWEQVAPEGWAVVDIYHPHSCPWDYYGGKHQREYGCVLKRAGVEFMLLTKRETHTCPHGTGPGGAVRFGDSMMPGVYSIAVPDDSVDIAKYAIAEHCDDLEAWIAGRGAFPEACKN